MTKNPLPGACASSKLLCGLVDESISHLVLKNSDIEKYLTIEEMNTLQGLIIKIGRGRMLDRKPPINEYYICNLDEPYAAQVSQTIIHGELDKEKDRLLYTKVYAKANPQEYQKMDTGEIVEVMQFTNENKDIVFHWAASLQMNVYPSTEDKQPVIKIPPAQVPSNDEESTVYLGDWIIYDGDMDLYPVCNNFFQQKFRKLRRVE